MLGEGLALFLIVWWFSSKPRPAVAPWAACSSIGYAVFRFLAEFAREPDDFLGLVLGPFTMGQLLCVPMLIAGLWLLMTARRRGVPMSASA